MKNILKKRKSIMKPIKKKQKSMTNNTERKMLIDWKSMTEQEIKSKYIALTAMVKSLNESWTVIYSRRNVKRNHIQMMIILLLVGEPTWKVNRLWKVYGIVIILLLRLNILQYSRMGLKEVWRSRRYKFKLHVEGVHMDGSIKFQK